MDQEGFEPSASSNLESNLYAKEVLYRTELLAHIIFITYLRIYQFSYDIEESLLYFLFYFYFSKFNFQLIGIRIYIIKIKFVLWKNYP